MPRAAPPSSQPALLQSLWDVESTIPSWLCRPGFAITGVKCSQLSVSSFQQLLWLVGRIKKKKKGNLFAGGNVQQLRGWSRWIRDSRGVLESTWWCLNPCWGWEKGLERGWEKGAALSCASPALVWCQPEVRTPFPWAGAARCSRRCRGKGPGGRSWKVGESRV